MKEAGKYVTVNNVWKNPGAGYTKGMPEPKDWNIDPNGKYFYFCDNETVNGIEHHNFPFEKMPQRSVLVADMSSNICSRRIDWEKYGVCYGGA